MLYPAISIQVQAFLAHFGSLGPSHTGLTQAHTQTNKLTNQPTTQTHTHGHTHRIHKPETNRTRGGEMTTAGWLVLTRPIL